MSTENEMTVLELDDATNVALTDILYLVQGNGSNRDRKMTISQLRDFISSVFSSLSVIGTGANITMSNSTITIAGNNHTITISVASGSEGVTIDGVRIYEVTESGPSVVLKVSENLECLKNLIVNYAATFRDIAKFYNDAQIKHLVNMDVYNHDGTPDYEHSTQTAYETAKGGRCSYYLLGNYQQGEQQVGGITAFTLDQDSSNLTKGEMIIIAVSGVQGVTVRGFTIPAGSAARFLYNGTNWIHLC